MKLLYLGFTFLIASTLFNTATGQIQIVKNHYPASKEFGLTPEKITSNSKIMLFSGAGDGLVSQLLGTRIFPEPFITDGTADNFIEFDLNPLLGKGNLKSGSNPRNMFVFKDEIYFTATSDTATALYKISEITGTPELVTSKWVPQYQPQVEMHGFPATEKVLFIGKNPADSEDTNHYLLEWNGTDEYPKLAPNQKDMMGNALYNLDGSKGFFHIGGASNALIYSATSPDSTLGTEVCVYTSNMMGATATFTDLYPGFKVVNNVEYPNNGSPEDFTLLDGVVYFNSALTNEVWKIDIGAGETTAVRVDKINDYINLNTTLELVTTYKGKLLIAGVATTEDNTTATDPRNLFLFDPADESLDTLITTGTYELRDINSPIVWNDTLYFCAQYRTIPYDHAQNATPLFRYDGTEIVNMTPDLVNVGELHIFKDKMYFSANDPQGEDNGDGTFSPTYNELFVYKASTSTNVSKVRNANQIEVWPNPSSGVLNFSGIKDGGSYALFNLSGKCLNKGVFTGNQLKYDVEKGMYVLRLESKNQSYVTKILVN